MQDTATAGYYAELAQINDQLAAAGVATIKLVKIEWGDVALTGPTTATATTYETWQTTWADKSTDQSRDRNVYTLVQEQGAWKIQADEHPDSSAPGPSGQATPAPRGQPPSTAPAAPSDLSQSHNWSGYAATGGKFTSVTGTWTIPQSDGDGNAGTSASWVGIGGVSSRDLIQAGTQQLTGGTGTVRYSAWVEILPQSSRPVPFKVGPGDSVTVTITQQQGSQWLIAFKNNTSGEAYQTNLEYQSSLSSAEWIHEAPSGRRAILPLDDFGQVHFSAGSAVRDGESLSISQLGAQAITMIDAGGNSVATPSSLTADGGGFSITQSPPSQMAPGNAAPRIRPRRVPSGAGGA